MGDNVLVVFGATGTQGRGTLEHFVRSRTNQEGRWKIKGVTRDTGSLAALSLQTMGVEMVAADLNDVHSLHRILQDATHVFANTDSNRLIHHASHNPSVLKVGESPTAYAKLIELQQGRNLRDALVGSPRLERVVWSSLTSPSKWSGGRYRKVTMFDAKEEIADMLQAETSLQDKLSVLLVGFYANNALQVPELYAPSKQADGAYILSLPMAGDVPVPFAHVEVDIGKWIEALFKSPPGLVLEGASDYHTWNQWAEVWGIANNVKASYSRAHPDEFATRKSGIGEAVAEEFQFIGEFGFSGGNSQVVTVRELESHGAALQGTSMKSYIESCDWSNIL